MSQTSHPTRTRPRWLTARPAVVGHRGAAAHAPENTLESFRAALGADAVETDLQLSADQVPFLLHDDTLVRTTDGVARGVDPQAPASSVPWDSLAALDAGAWFDPEFDGARLARLDELADLLLQAHGSDVPLGLDLEIKSPVAHAARTVVSVVARALAGPVWAPLIADGQVMVTSFDPEVVAFACEDLPVPVGLLTAATPPVEDLPGLAELGLAALVTSHEDLTAPVVDAAHALGLVVGVYTANDPADWDRLRAIDVDLIVTDDPQALLRHLGR